MPGNIHVGGIDADYQYRIEHTGGTDFIPLEGPDDEGTALWEWFESRADELELPLAVSIEIRFNQGDWIPAIVFEFTESDAAQGPKPPITLREPPG